MAHLEVLDRNGSPYHRTYLTTTTLSPPLLRVRRLLFCYGGFHQGAFLDSSPAIVHTYLHGCLGKHIGLFRVHWSIGVDLDDSTLQRRLRFLWRVSERCVSGFVADDRPHASLGGHGRTREVSWRRSRLTFARVPWSLVTFIGCRRNPPDVRRRRLCIEH